MAFHLRKAVGSRAIQWTMFARHLDPSTVISRGFLSATLPLLEKKSMDVPTMGDSITEGTIVEWTAQVGQAVKADDVVAMVETDKVTVEIKAEIDGVVTQHFGEVDETVEVGAPLYEIDTEAEASVEAAAAASEAKDTAPPSAPEPTKVAAVEAPKPAAQRSSRSPSIHFLGKDGWLARLSGQESSSSSSFVGTIHPMYGRPHFTDAEMEALLLGGANIAPY